MQDPENPTMPTMDTLTDPRLQIMSILAVPLYLFDVDTVAIVWANDAATDFWEADSSEELCQRDMGSNATTTVKLRLSQIRQECFNHGKTVTEHWTVYPKNIPKSAAYRISAFHASGDRQLLLMHVVNEKAISEDEIALKTTALMHTSTMISAFDKELHLVYCNTAARQSIPETVTTAQQRIPNALQLQGIVDHLHHHDTCDAEVQIKTRLGLRWHAVHVQRCINPTNGRTMYLTSEIDITEERKAKQEVYRLAFTDSLTGLPNRAALNKNLDKILESELSVSFAILFLDLDRFKVINDSLGHAVGDQLLIDVALRLRQALGKEGVVSRIGGDEFVMLTTRSVEYGDLKRIAEQTLFAMTSPVMVSGHKLRVLPSIGISIYPTDGKRVSAIMENADAAMYMAKTNQCGYCFYDAKMTSSISENVKDRMGLENDMVTAIVNDEFELYFQPKISCRTLNATSVEALIRWHHPLRGMVPPDKFIGIAEETGQIVDLGNWVLVAAMRQQRRWHDQGLAIPVSVNISARQFGSNDLLADISHALEKTGCDPAMIELEITESMLIGEPDSVYSTLQQISAMGMRLALDDFGTGYSNLAYLQNYPLNCLKIDKVFLEDRKRSMLTRTILNMGKVLGLEVVAEGVETSSQADWLIAHGCDLLQGFYFSKPQPVREITQYLLDNGVPRIDINDEAA
ncbi:MAG: putative bifunctional diguanylate cyclase/phosphodiesterase [Granulosicoccus sp.]